MQEFSNSSQNSEVGQTQENPTSGQALETVAQADYLNLQSESTKWRQGQIEATIKLVKKDKSELKDITDAKLRDSVVKTLFPWYSSYDEMVAIEGSDFSKKEDDDDNGIGKLQLQIKQLNYQNEKRELDAEINKIKFANPDLFKDSSVEEKLRDNLKLFSGTVDIKERVELAARLTMPNNIDSRTMAFKAMATTQATNNGSTSATQVAKTSSEKNIENVLEFLKLKK